MTKSHNTQFPPEMLSAQRLAFSKVGGANSEPRWNEASDWKTPPAPSDSERAALVIACVILWAAAYFAAVAAFVAILT
jgi:hypothetical protein